MDGKIQYYNIKFRYPTRREVEVLRGLTLHIPSGKRVALVGPSGCGKSTLIQLLQRLYDPDHGSVVSTNTAMYTSSSLSACPLMKVGCKLLKVFCVQVHMVRAK